MFKRFLSIVLAALIGAATPAVPAQAPSPAIERGLSVSAPAALPQLAQRLPDTIPPLYMLGGDDKIAPVASYNSTTDPFPSAILSHSRTSLATMFDSTGKLTYAPNNLPTYTNDFAHASWVNSGLTVTTGVSDPVGGTNATTLTATGATRSINKVMAASSASVLLTWWVRRRTGSGSVNFWTSAGGVGVAISPTASWAQYSTVVSPSGGNFYAGIVVGTSGDAIDVYLHTASSVTYETTPRAADQVITTSSAYYGPRIDYDPNTLTYAPNNLLLQSNTFSNAAWTKVSATITTGVLDRSGGTSASTLTATGAFANLYAFATTSSSHNVIQSIWIRRRTGTGKIWMKIASSGALFEITGQVTSGWTQVSISGAANASSTPNFLQLDTSGDAVDISEAGVSAVTYETTPRAQDQVITTSSAYYGPNTLAVKGLLIEEARTNLAVQSNSLSNASWVKSAGNTAASAAAFVLDGMTNVNLVTLVAGTSGHQTYQNYTATASAWTNSVYAKAGTVGWIGVGFASTVQADGAFFNLSNGTIGTVAASTTASIQNVGGGWYRCSVTRTLTAGATQITFEVHTADNQAYNFNAAGTETAYFFGAQAEAGSFATSYIPTAAASVTRAADVVQLTGAALVAVQGAQGAVIYEGNGSRGTSVIVGSGGSQYRPYISGTSFSAYDGTTVLSAVGTVPTSSVWRGGVTWSTAGRSITLNGGAVASDANGTGTFTNAYLGNNNGSLWINGHVASFAIYNQRLADGTLQSKSVVGASY